MINGLGVLGWGVGGIEAEAVMLGQPISMVLPKVVGYKINGALDPLVTSTGEINFFNITGPVLSKINKLCCYNQSTITNLNLAHFCH